MSLSPKKKKKADLDYIFKIVWNVITVLACITLLYTILYAYFNIYKPEEKKYIKGSRHAFLRIQEELSEYYKKNKYIYHKDEMGNISTEDEFCELLVKKYAKSGGDCTSSNSFELKENFTFKKTKIRVYGMEKPPFEFDGTLVKEFYIDVDGNKGKNTMGIDRYPLRIYSTGRMGGLLTTVNCKAEDARRYEIPYAKICQTGVDFNFLDSKIPIGYDIIQIGSKNGKSKRLNRNVSFLRADCSAFGAEMMGFDEYCEQRRYYWMTACYHEYPCAVEITGKFKEEG